MGRQKISLWERCNSYPKEEGFYIRENKFLMCRHCNVRLDFEKKDTLDKHIKGASHQAKKSAVASNSSGSVKRQAGLSESFENLKKSKMAKEELCHDVVKMCLKANIPLTKLDNEEVRSFFNKYVPGSGSLPSSDRLQRVYVSECGNEHKEQIREFVKDLPIVVVADETSDKNGRCVFAVLFRTVAAWSEQKVYLASCNFLDAANKTTCSQAIIDTLKEYNVSYENVIALVSDSAPYMTACFNALKILIGDHIIHLQCWAHKMNLVGDVFMKELKELNFTVSKVKIAFLHSRKMKAAYLSFLEQSYPQLPKLLFPDPVITRWNSWFHCVQYLDSYLPAIVEFLKTWENKNTSVDLLLESFENKTTSDLIFLQCKFVSNICTNIVSLIKKLEGSKYPFAHLLWEELECIKTQLKRNGDGLFSQSTKDLIDKMQEKNKPHARDLLKSAAQKSLLKLCTHTLPNATNIFLKELSENFNPAICGAKLSIDESVLLASLKKIPHFEKVPQNDLIEGYLSLHRHILKSVKSNEQPDVLQMLLCEKIKFEAFCSAALSAIWSPVNSVDAERYFSRYNLVVSDRRRRMKEETIQTCSMLAFN